MPAYSNESWSATIPWSWFKNGVTLVVASRDGSATYKAALRLDSMGPALTHKLQRVKSIIFGTYADVSKPDMSPTTVDASMLVRDMWSIMPFSEVQRVDSVAAAILSR